MSDLMAASAWSPLTPAKWAFPGDEVVLVEAGDNPGPPRRPFEYAVVTAGVPLGSFQLDAEVRIDEPVADRGRDVVVLFGYQGPTRFCYAHLCQDNTVMPHNGLFVVDDADRERIDDQWDGAVGPPPAISDDAYHRCRLVRDADTGAIAVFVDDLSTPLLTATDRRLGTGRVGFGSFDNYGRIRDLTVTALDAG